MSDYTRLSGEPSISEALQCANSSLWIVPIVATTACHMHSLSPPGPMYKLTLAVCCVVLQENLPLVKLLRLLVSRTSMDVVPLMV